MASYIPYFPGTTITKAMFNFDAFGITNYILAGTIRISVSDDFSYANYYSDKDYSLFNSGIYTNGPNEYVWTTTQLNNIDLATDVYAQFANLSFTKAVNYEYTSTSTIANPEDVGRSNVTDININWIYRTDVSFAGKSGGSTDKNLGYTGAAGDIFLNEAAEEFQGDYSLSPYSRATQTLMHELGHSLGLSHPHISYTNGTPVISADFAATQYLGFNKLGFKTSSAADMYKEYFTIMSYDDQNYSATLHAYTPMILDVIALQQAYGEGRGTSGVSDDTLQVGTDGYRTYFDKGGIDTVDLSLYSNGAYFHMGTTITGASHLVGVAMSLYDGANTIVYGGSPVSLRWFYGEYENAVGSAKADVIFGNDLANNIYGGAGNDGIDGMGGNDSINGGDGNDSMNGGDGNDTLIGGAGNDLFDWDEGTRSGNDIFVGGTGDDVYVLDTSADKVYENSGEGIDTVWVNFNSSLASYSFVENIRIYGSTGTYITGSSYANWMSGGGGNDTIDGADGKDLVQCAGNISNYTVTKSGNDYIVKDKTGAEGTDLLKNIELIKFDDHYLSFETAGIAGQAYRLYQAAFDRKPDLAGLGYWINDMSNGSSLTTVASGFFSSPEFQKLYGKSPSNTTLITNFYQNVLHRAPDKAGFDYWLNSLDTGKISAAGALASFCESAENQALVIAAIQNGIEYIGWTA
ncbi:DUF4214 domain-containing protein [Undibacterium sp. CY18W]|uniref:DUF4214 domain-containing protein n=1 Tax=Undibacterium hunanense TaxID=2762292 RepID=A0ABR6ZT19_9BURK|nr:DUF4214 domain-containing protein [Undibacterium hunanense]MBC3919048.1 DUF4214 domain-containing protein [Undibacterium hunanense]